MKNMAENRVDGMLAFVPPFSGIYIYDILCAMAMSIKPNCDAMAMALCRSKALVCLASFSGAYEDSEICARALDGRSPRGTFNLTVTVAVTFRTESDFFFSGTFPFFKIV